MDSSQKRHRISKRLRFSILQRDGFKCRYCGKSANEAELHVDHVVPYALGGSNDAENLVTACHDCNSGKSSTLLDSPVVAEISASNAIHASLIAQAIADDFEQEVRRSAFFDEEWSGWASNGRELPRPATWAASISAFRERGMTEQQIVECVRIAMESPAPARDVFRYFCGVCWRKIERAEGFVAEFRAVN